VTVTVVITSSTGSTAQFTDNLSLKKP
jgi:hypothetical protein